MLATAGSGQYDPKDIMVQSEKQQPVYELSLNKAGSQKPKPHKLKPLQSSKLSIDNKANSVLEIENAYQREMHAEIMNDIDNDLKDYFDTNKLFSQMQSAFGEPSDKKPTSLNQATAEYLKKQKQKKSKAGSSSTLTAADMNSSSSQLSSSMLAKTSLVAKNDLLDPIIEEGVTGGALALYEPGTSSVAVVEQRAKKNEALKKRVKMATGGGSIGPTSISSLSDASTVNGVKSSFAQNPSSETDTFITGTRLQGPKDSDMQVALAEPEMDDKMLREYEAYLARKKTKHYKYEEDELLDDLEQHEHDMNEMLKYLAEVEDMVKVGHDLKSIEQMMQVTKETMDQHFQACDKFKGSLTEIEAQAETAIKILNFYQSDGANIDGSHTGKGGGQLQRVIEDEGEADAAERMDAKKNKVSQEHSKSQIVSQLGMMNDSMRQFTSQLESRLDKAYRSGATKKFGYDGLTNLSSQTAFEDGKKEERALNRIQSLASQFVAENSKSSTPSAHQAQFARKNSQVKALPPSSKDSEDQILKPKLPRKGSVKASARPVAQMTQGKKSLAAGLNSDISSY